MVTDIIQVRVFFAVFPNIYLLLAFRKLDQRNYNGIEPLKERCTVWPQLVIAFFKD